MYYLDLYHSFVNEGICSGKYFDEHFFSYLNDGILFSPFDHDDRIVTSEKEKKSFFEKIVNLFKKK